MGQSLTKNDRKLALDLKGLIISTVVIDPEWSEIDQQFSLMAVLGTKNANYPVDLQFSRKAGRILSTL